MPEIIQQTNLEQELETPEARPERVKLLAKQGLKALTEYINIAYGPETYPDKQSLRAEIERRRQAGSNSAQ